MGILVVMAIFARLILAFSGTSYQPDPQIYLLLGAATLGSFAVLIVTDWQNAKGAFFWWLSGAVMAFGGALLLFGNLNDLDKRRLACQTRRPRNRSGNSVTHCGTCGFNSQARRRQLHPLRLRARLHRRPPLFQSFHRSSKAAINRAAAGTFYMVDRATVITKTGVRAVRPGDTVQLRERLRDGKLRVTFAGDTFVVNESQVTDDLGTAREAEKRDFLRQSARL